MTSSIWVFDLNSSTIPEYQFLRRLALNHIAVCMHVIYFLFVYVYFRVICLVLLTYNISDDNLTSNVKGLA